MNFKIRPLFLSLLFIVLYVSCPSPAAAEIFQSGEDQTVLLELYTSEGCSSCPPAEQWMTQLKNAPGLWKSFVPVAFHVDYWDYLGWKDVLSSPNYSQRQRN